MPTYNEAENIASMLRQLLSVADDLDMPAQILVVDDESPDGTAEVVEDIRQEDSRVLLLSGPKKGLGSAYTRGFDYVLSELEVDAVVQLDADFSHDPQDIPRLLDQLVEADVVIGSRYVPGGEVDSRWSVWRRILSWGGNVIARLVAGIYRVRDCTAGFKAIRVTALRSALPLRFRVQGYVFQVALLHHLMIDGAEIQEVPIKFRDRSLGSTKLGQRDVLEFLFQVWMLRLLSRKTFVKFALTGMSGVVVNLANFQALVSAGMNAYLSSAIAIELSIVSNFFLNNYWTFRHRSIRTRKRIRGLKFNFISVFTLAVSFGSFVGLLYAIPEISPLVAQAISILPGAMMNYFANSYWTFKSDAV